MTARLTAWLMDLSRRERTLLAAAGAVTLGVVVLAAAFAVRDDLAALRARVAGRERELGEVRRLAARLHQEEGASSSTPDSALFTRLQAAVDESVGRERLAMLGDSRGKPGRKALALHEDFVGQPEGLAEDEADPEVMNGALRLA